MKSGRICPSVTQSIGSLGITKPLREYIHYLKINVQSVGHWGVF